MSFNIYSTRVDTNIPFKECCYGHALIKKIRFVSAKQKKQRNYTSVSDEVCDVNFQNMSKKKV